MTFRGDCARNHHRTVQHNTEARQIYEFAAYFDRSVDGHPAPLVIVRHGDAPFVNPRYQYAFAAQLARAAKGTRVAALLRPGYADPYGAKSDGNRGFATAENYTREVIDQIAAAIRRSQWRAPSVVLVGHSGGAALATDMAALDPGSVEHVSRWVPM